MAKQDINPMALNAVLGGENITDPKQQKLMDLLIRSYELQVGEAENTQARKEEELSIRRQMAEAARLKMIQMEEAQNLCHHLKESGRPNIAGQRDHANNYHYLCLGCNKHWVNNLPFNLQIPMELVGGPN